MADGLLALLSALNGYGQGSLQRQQTNQQRALQQAALAQQQAQAQADAAWQQQQFAAQQAQQQAELQARQTPTFADQMDAMNDAYETGSELSRAQQPGYFQGYNSIAARSGAPLLPVPGVQNGTRPRNFGLTDPSTLSAALADPARNLPPGAQGPPAYFTSPALGTQPLSAYAAAPPVPTYNPYFDSDDDTSDDDTSDDDTPSRPSVSAASPAGAAGPIPPMPVRVVANGQGQIVGGVTVPPASPLPATTSSDALARSLVPFPYHQSVFSTPPVGISPRKRKPGGGLGFSPYSP